MTNFEQDRDLLIRLWRMWAKRAAELSDEQWTADTRLPGWTVRDVYVHVTPDVMIAMLAEPAADGDAKITSAAEMLRVFNVDPTATEPMHEQLAEIVRQMAADVDRESIVKRFDIDLPESFERLTGLSRATVIAHPMLESVSLGAFLDMAILESTVHWLDVVAAVGGPEPEPMALERAREVLAAVPDPLAFVEAATGRSHVAVLPVMR
ncbi:maleylpyruvate isomerase N-terminal domain-containing protein [Rhodococcus sp. IEGM 1366]|uniref:maleylpyruvate isomerase N-terminal domain-containing protein n=1 Tax=Rhodococcus sp. IEGM 1366 TaxID=3082223 RepID=UPI00295418D0|nr:maleylpyruvate isomerase N-terminal domain-containing protein [Rhodococcus sp. IEGM 1366]MDV8070832.1 maleylpyruvate isomerase N-terminal domain-containing protein [Rhodococcus sp. IEGM 1366]